MKHRFTRGAGGAKFALMRRRFSGNVRGVVIWAAFSAVVGLGLSSCGTSPPIGERVPVAAGQTVRANISSANRLKVYEGLPHQVKEKALLERELGKKGVTRILGYPFYGPAVTAKNGEALRKLMSDPASYRIYTGPKTCGGFHPDYALAWEVDGVTQHVLVCYGCGEALFSDGTRLLPYDLKHAALYELRELLGDHARRRPMGG